MKNNFLQNNENELVHDVLRFSKEHKDTTADWQKFLNTIKDKYVKKYFYDFLYY